MNSIASLIVSAKRAQDSLAITHESTFKVKQTKLRLFTSLFESFKMSEVETFNKLYARFCNTANACLNIEER